VGGGIGVLYLGARCGSVIMPHPGHFTPGKEERDLVPIVQEAGWPQWALGLVWMGVENLVPNPRLCSL